VAIARSTIIGELCVHAIELGENSIFYGKVCAERRQHGCVRFCYVTPESRTLRSIRLEAIGRFCPIPAIGYAPSTCRRA
jgi:hypothetical protein